MNIITSIIIGVLSSFSASIVFTLFLRKLKPKISISDKISKSTESGKFNDSGKKEYFAIKIINHRKRECLNVQAELTLTYSRNVGGGKIYRSTKIELVKEKIISIPKFQKKSEDCFYAFRFRTLKNLEEMWQDENSHYRFRIIATDPISGISKVFEKKYYTIKNTFSEGQFEKGLSMIIS